jgi:hypothetical protein
MNDGWQIMFLNRTKFMVLFKSMATHKMGSLGEAVFKEKEKSKVFDFWSILSCQKNRVCRN